MTSKKPWVHFVGMCAPAVGGVAVMLKKQGWKVTGSDKDVYPPASVYLKQNNLKLQNGFDAGHITPKINLVILGGGAMIMDRNNPEVFESKRLGLKMLSWAKFLGDNLVKSNSIVVSGTYGKTTITAMLVKIFRDSGIDPSYEVAGFALDLVDTVYIGSSDYSIVEGDEHPAVLYFDEKSKFEYYKPKYLLLTSAKWDHFNVFPRKELYIERFIRLVKNVPEDGLIVACKKGENLEKIVKYSKSRVVYYHGNEYGGKLRVLGEYQRQNASGAFVMARELGISKSFISDSLASFKGVKRRLEIRLKTRSMVMVEDFAQHPFKISEVLKSLRKDFRSYKILLILDPFASILRSKTSLYLFRDAFNFADKVFIRKIKTSVKRKDRLTGPDMVKIFGDNSVYIPLDGELINNIQNETKKGKSVVLVCSSGDIESFVKSLINKLGKNAA